MSQQSDNTQANAAELDGIKRVQAEADCLITATEVEAQIEQQAQLLSAELAEANPLFLVVMNGALFYAQRLLSRLNFPLQQDYLHASRYRGETRGAELQWYAKPRTPLAGRCVVLLDDILDEGPTLAGIRDYCLAEQAAAVKIAVLVEKQHNRRVPGLAADYPCLSVPDRYVFGCGMDYHEYHRQLPCIYAVKGS